MSEVRTTSEIQQEYGQICAQLGELQFQIEVMKAKIQDGNTRILALGKEMQAAEQKEKANVTSATAKPAA